MLIRVIPLAEFRELLGPDGEQLSDEEVLRIWELEYRLSGIIFELWLARRRKGKTKAT